MVTTTVFMRRIASRIAQLRDARELSQEDLAAKADISTGYLSSLERGKQTPRVTVLLKIAGALGIPLTELVAVEQGDEAADKSVSQEIERITARLKKCDVKTVRRIRKSIEALTTQ